LIGVDWGTSNFRAFRFDETGNVIDRRFYPTGILKVQEGKFADTLQAQVGDWIAEGETRILLCGMVGSRQGWAEAEYLECPVKVDDLATAVVLIPTGNWLYRKFDPSKPCPKSSSSLPA